MKSSHTKSLRTIIITGLLLFISSISVSSTITQVSKSLLTASSYDAFANFISTPFVLFELKSPPQSTLTPPPPNMFPGGCKDSNCDTGSSPKITIENGGAFDWDGTWPESIEQLFKSAKQKQDALLAWLNSQCTDPNCKKLVTGPKVNIRVQPKDPVIGSCTIHKSGNNSYTATGVSTTSCADATKIAQTALGKKLANMEDPCKECGWDWNITDFVTSCTQTPPPVKYTATASLNVAWSCADKGDGEYNGWIEWSACYCCQAIPPATPGQGGGVVSPVPVLPKTAI